MTTRPEMTVEEHVQTALLFLEHADGEFAAGDDMQGSEKLWGAASHAVTAMAKRRGWQFGKYNHRMAAVGRLAREMDDNSLVAAYLAARQFHANFYYDFLESEEIAEGRPAVRDFVHRIADMV